ncbi:protein of unknown function [Azospirillum baldaniorum]|uniref:Uncharacterized protein n=1 Tax=Azospirillum baldaniorum TaxID=1064539 RepID=A0A9P1JQ88_9PROT|nr:protein of unknown function [Azospirillum baldaniorum]
MVCGPAWPCRGALFADDRNPPPRFCRIFAARASKSGINDERGAFILAYRVLHGARPWEGAPPVPTCKECHDPPPGGPWSL